MTITTGWLIEAPTEGFSPSYLCIRTEDSHLGAFFRWTDPNTYFSEHEAALRFARRQDAEQLVSVLYRLCPHLLIGPPPDRMPKIVEHSWDDHQS